MADETRIDSMRIDYVALEDVEGAERNPKRHDYDEIRKAILRSGFRAPLSRDERTGKLVAGHGRLETLRRMQAAGEDMPNGLRASKGRWLVPIICGMPFANETEAEAFIVADNRISALGGWDTDGLNEILLEQIDLYGSLDGLGFSEDDLMDLADSVTAMPLIDDGAEAPEDIACTHCDGDGCEACDPAQLPDINEDATNEADDGHEPEVTETEFADGDTIEFDGHTIHCGDCVEVLKRMPDNSIDSIVCDPPYLINFMGRKWDSAKDGNEMQAWHSRWCEQAFRVLKPGGHIIAFSSTRTVHRLAVAIEDVGFEIRDTINWLYWCLDADTEILTDNGWERHDSENRGSKALCLDTDTGKFAWQPIAARPVFDFSGELVRVRGSLGEHFVTDGHRCVVEQDGAYSFTKAENLAQESSACIPVLEDLRAVLDSVSVPDKRAGDTEQDMLARVCRDVPEAAQSTNHSGASNVRDMRQGVPKAAGMGQAYAGALLLMPMQRDRAGESANRAPESRQGRDNTTGDCEALSQNARGEKPGMEGRRNQETPQRELPEARNLGGLPAGVLGDGAQERLRASTQVGSSGAARESSYAIGSGAPCRPRSGEQLTGEFDAVCDQQRSQEIRGARLTTPDLVRTDRVAYEGKVWCITVPTGAFVARRNGMVFVTGNTGFPKSMNVAKAIDKAAGAEREVVGTDKSFGKTKLEDGKTTFGDYAGEWDITVPATDDAKQWDGWGTALKPAQEPAILARKPADQKTLVANVLEHGTGGLNINACRIVPGDKAWPGPQTGNAGTQCPDFPEPCKGHKSDGKYGDTFHAMPSTTSTHSRRVERSSDLPGGYGEQETHQTAGQQLGRFPANIYVCAKPHRSEKEAGLEDFAHASAGEVTGGRKEGSDGLNSPRAGAGRTSGSKNIHPTVKPVRLMRWLIRLVTPEHGLVLDTFLGSGTTMVAAQREGFNCVGIELDPMFATIAKARVEHAIEDGGNE